MSIRPIDIAACAALMAAACGGASATDPAAGPATVPHESSAPRVSAESPVERPEHGPFLDVAEALAKAVIYGPDRICTSACEFEYVAQRMECGAGTCAVTLRATYPDRAPETAQIDVAWPRTLPVDAVESTEFFAALAHAVRRWQAAYLGVDHAEDPPPDHSGRPGFALTETFAADVVAGLNEICGDTFCEGELMWRFDALTCTGEACTLAFEATHDGAAQSDSVTWPWFGPAIDELWVDEDVRDAFHEALLAGLEQWERVRYEQLLGP